MNKTIFSIIAASALATVPAQAVVYNFTNVSGNNAGDAAIGEAQLSVDVTSFGVGTGQNGADQVLFTFNDAGPAASSITDIYFDDGTLLGIASFINGSGVSFSQGAAPPNLPAGQNINFNTTAGFLADSNAPAQPNGVNPGETLGIVFDLINGKSFADTIAALNATDPQTGNTTLANGDDLRIGIHVQGYASGGSETFVNVPGNPTNPPPPPGVVPEPSTYAMFGTAFFMLAFLGYRSRNKKS